MDSQKAKRYLKITRKRFDPVSIAVSTAGLVVVIGALTGTDGLERLWDLRSFIIILGGTLATLLFQFDFVSCFECLWLIVRSMVGTPGKDLVQTINQVDFAILNGQTLGELRDGLDINGELLNDVVYMHRQGLLYEEIDQFITSRISDEYLGRSVAVTMMHKASSIAPTFGLFGTVIGLIGVLKSLSNPAEIGPSMSLALLTTAYGTGLGALLFTPVAGRLEHHNTIFLEVHKQFLKKISILIAREDRNLDVQHEPEVNVA